MERNAAACAMDWSIELEKGLRSKKPGQVVEAISQIGHRLEQWSREPEPTMSVYSMFNLFPGEDRLFENTILLRLADTFLKGDKHVRLAVVKIFLSEWRHRNKKMWQHGILTKSRVNNHLELLRRVKLVYGSGDVESRALSLILLGCWAHFSKDSAEIRYMILSTLVSSDVLEVKASMFAAGCLCELCTDFANVVLEMLVNMFMSSETPVVVRLAGAKAFGKIGSSSLLADKAYRTGVRILLDPLEEDFLVRMLISLSKLSLKSAPLISEQIGLLFSYLTSETTLHVRTVALRSLDFILERRPPFFPSTADSIQTLISILAVPRLSPSLQLQVVQILHKVLFCTLPNLDSPDIFEFSKLLKVVEHAAHSTDLSVRLLAIRFLVDIVVKKPEMEFNEASFNRLPTWVISIIQDKINILLEKSVQDSGLVDSELNHEVQSLLKLLLLVVVKYPNLVDLVLDHFASIINYIFSMHDVQLGQGAVPSYTDMILDFEGGKYSFIRSKFVNYIHKFLMAVLSEIDGLVITEEVVDKVKLLIKKLRNHHLFDTYSQIMYSLLLTPVILCNFWEDEKMDICNLDKTAAMALRDYLIESEAFAVECAKKLLVSQDNWNAYRVGRYAACQGAWTIAASVFEQQIARVQSSSCTRWLTYLAQFSNSEKKIRVLLPTDGLMLINWLEVCKISGAPFMDDSNQVCPSTARIGSLCKCSEKLNGTNDIHQISEEPLGTILSSDLRFVFPKWFMFLRAKLLKIVVAILNTLETVPFHQDYAMKGHGERVFLIELPGLAQRATSWVNFLTRASLQLNKLAPEFDLLASSFIDMDSRSLEIISTLALSCSLLAFITGFALPIQKFPAFEKTGICSTETSDTCSSELVQNLVARLWNIDCDANKNLRLLLTVCEPEKKHSRISSRNQILRIGCEARSLIKVCNYAAEGLVRLHEGMKTVQTTDESQCHLIRDGLQLLLDVLKKWMCIPFQSPPYLFKARPCVLSELFASSTNKKKPELISVSPGFHLSLNLCLQLKNLPPCLPVQSTRIYCILSCKKPLQTPGHGGQSILGAGFQALEADEIIDLNRKLFSFVTEGGRGINQHYKGNVNDDQVVSTYVCFEPNERGQGFSRCTLDVSSFPVGSYLIKWHSCCVDNMGNYWNLLPSNSGPSFTVQ